MGSNSDNLTAERLHCPSCGGPVQFQSSISLLTICPYCRSALIRRDLKIENLGRIADLAPERTPVQIGSAGIFNRVAFSVVGRIQLGYEDGVWSEWFITFQDGRSGWLGEAMGQYRVSFQTAAKDLPVETELQPGQSLSLNGKIYSVTDIEEARYTSAEGELPFEIPLGKSATLVDLGADDGSFATLDCSDDPCTLYVGQYVSFDDLRLQNLRT